MNAPLRDASQKAGSAQAGPVLSVDGLAKDFDGKPVLHGLDFAVHAGVATALIGAGTLGAILLKVIERIFARADKRDDLAVGLRGEMVRRIETLEKNYTAMEARERQWYERSVRLEAENRQLRQRYHALINWMAQQPGLPTPPTWLYERVGGPTEDERPQPPRTPPQEPQP